MYLGLFSPHALRTRCTSVDFPVVCAYSRLEPPVESPFFQSMSNSIPQLIITCQELFLKLFKIVGNVL